MVIDVKQRKDIRVAFYTLGCKLNQAETESLAGQFSQAGYQLVAPNSVADIYIANTCTVTHVADRKSRHWLRLARRRNPEAFIIATGCYAQRAPHELAQLANLVLNNEEKNHLLALTQTLSLEGRGHSSYFSSPSKGEDQGEGEKTQSHVSNGITRVRSLIKIQDGCHSPCAYCIVPKVRPHEYSLSASQIIGEIEQRVARGYKEVVLTGTKVGCYSDDGANLSDLIESILHDTTIERLRLSSLQPQQISSEFLALWQDRRLCRHFHLALQSGSDTMLQRMRRRYSLDDYQRAIDLIREAIPQVAITTDIMVGFPGESDEEFGQSYRFCQQAGFANIHVFPFSLRPGTEAAKMPHQVRDEIKKERTQRMLQLATNCRYSFCEQFIGQTMPVLWEKETNLGRGIYSGLTDNYIRVFTQSQEPLTNKITVVKLVGFHKQGMWGELVEYSELK